VGVGVRNGVQPDDRACAQTRPDGKNSSASATRQMFIHTENSSIENAQISIVNLVQWPDGNEADFREEFWKSMLPLIIDNPAIFALKY
jgi:hypothetical protein